MKPVKRLLLPLLWAALASVQAQNSDVQRPFWPEIQAFLQEDSLVRPVRGEILLYGSSSFRLWKTASTDLAFDHLRIVNRGFGGSQASDAVRYFYPVVAPHRPRWLILYEGDNDLAAGKTVDSTFADLRTCIELSRKHMPQTRVIVLSAKPSPSRIGLLSEQLELNQKIRAYCRKIPAVFYVDIATPMLDPATGQPRPELFIEDKLHMNEKGYALWTKTILDCLRSHSLKK
jgi:lysophospholipase L1-like esterase